MVRWFTLTIGLLTLALLSSGCGRIWGTVSWLNQNINLQLNVQKLYPNNGANWTYYVKNDGADIFSASDTACVGTEIGYAGCLHGAQMLKVPLLGVSSCAGLTMTDSLGVFVWSCVVKSGLATFFSTDFQIGAGLQNIVTAGGWNDDSVVLSGTNGNITYTGTSTPTVWWSNVANPVTPLPNNSLITDAPVALNSSGAIYILTSSRGSEGYNITASHIAVTTLPGVTLNYAGKNNPAYCNAAYMPIICSGAQNYLWIEGNYDANSGGGTDGAGLIHFYGGPTFSRLHLVTIKNSTSTGMEFYSPTNFIFDQIKTSNNGMHGFGIDNATNCFVKNLTSDNNVQAGVRLGNIGGNSTGNVFYQIASSNNGASQGMFFIGANNNSLVQTVFDNNTSGGLDLNNTAGGNTISQVTVTNTGTGNMGLFIEAFAGNTFNTLNSVVSVNNSFGVGVSTNANNNTLSQIVATNNATNGILLNGTSNNNFAGSLLVGQNASDCSVGGGITPGLANATCANNGTSTAVLGTNRDLTSSFTGKVTTTDTANNSNVNGSAAAYPGAPKTFDFGDFQNLFRGWGLDGAAFPVAGNRGQWTVGVGRIWDWRLSAADTVILNKSGDGSSTNGMFLPGGNCPSASYGNITATDQSGRTFLLNASEIVDPFTTGYSNTGNHNGLCESNEACVYSPNFGAYQGEGSLQSCNFVQNGGGVSGVTMYGYTKNGN